MFNPDVIFRLLKESGKSPMDLAKSLWGNDTHTTPAYFRDHPNIRTDMLEKLSVFFDVPMEVFFDKPFPGTDSNHVVGHHNNVGSTVNITNDLTTENYYLKQNLKTLESLVDAKDEVIKTLKSSMDAVLHATNNQNNK